MDCKDKTKKITITAQRMSFRLKAPLVALERIANGKHLPKIFAELALDELRKAQRLADRLGKQKKR